MPFDVKQKRVYELALAGNNQFVSGGGGVGKTYVVQEVIDELRKQGRNVLVCAFTKLAALNLDPQNGLTIFKAFNTYPKGLSFDDAGLKRLRRSSAMNADVIIIDEISMCSKGLFSYVSQAIRTISYEKGYKNIQLIVLGDFHQLPPVAKGKLEIEYAFESHYWNTWGFEVTILGTPHRQSDPEFVRRLDQIRRGENIMENLRYIKDNSHYLEKNEDVISLCSYRADVAALNNERIERLPGECRHYLAAHNSQNYMEDLTVWEDLKLKVGTLVMTIYNDPSNRFYNGLTGHILELLEDAVVVEFSDSTPYTPHIVKIGRQRWEDNDNGYYVCQLPIIPAYSITIHKAQGCTLDAVNVNPKCFADGQLYVALSRVKNIKNLYITDEIRPEYIKVNPKVLDFYSKYE